MASVPFCGQHAFSLPSWDHNVTSSAASGLQIFRYRWRVEDSYESLLFFRQNPVSTTGSHSGFLWPVRTALHAERYQLHNILHSDLHHVASGTSVTKVLVRCERLVVL